jgi:RND family efflux transporter MFP subunit
MKAKIILSLVAAALVALVVVRVRSATRAKPPEAVAEQVLVGTARVARADLPLTVSMTGTVRPRNEVEILSKVSGRVESVHAQVGDSVRPGQLLAWIEHKEIGWQAKASDAALAVARANYDGAKLDFDRTQILFQGQSASQMQLDGAKVKLDLARAQVAQAEAAAGLAHQQLDNARIESPVAGTVTRRPIDVGAQVGTQTALFTIQDVAALKLESAVDAASFARLAPGQLVEVKADGVAGSWTGEVKLLSPSLDPQSRRASVEIAIDNSKGKLLPNTFARAEVTVGARSAALVIPREALLQSPGGAVVYRVRDGKVEALTPKLGPGDERRVVIEAGLAEGDVVAISGLANLADGAAVKVAETAGALGRNP